MSDIGWNPGPTIALVVERMRRGLGRVGAKMEGDAKELVSRPNTPVRGPKGGKARGVDPSRPGEPPKRVFGHLRSAIGFQVIVTPGLLVLRFGVFRGSAASSYAAALEFGFAGARHIAAHTRTLTAGFVVSGKKRLRFKEALGPGRVVQVGPFVRSFVLAARPYIRPTYRATLPKIPQLLARAS